MKHKVNSVSINIANTVYTSGDSVRRKNARYDEWRGHYIGEGERRPEQPKTGSESYYCYQGLHRRSQPHQHSDKRREPICQPHYTTNDKSTHLSLSLSCH